ncbi:MAG: phosphatase PAP2 family protein [Bacteroidia bacterium]|nr:phosphatase PAP2 family protein [Bacteroidia bacterium]
MLIITSLFYASSAKSAKEKVFVFLKSAVALIAVFGILAYLNEHYTKPVLKSQRPSHIYILDQTGLSNTIDSLYQLDKKTRQKFFTDLITSHPKEFTQIDPDILQHWQEEAGFSFPSGHTFNAFLFAMILSYAILFNRSYPSLRKLFSIPFIWAALVGISRVAMGAHTAFDVTAGAILGISLGFLFLYSDHTRHWLTRKD